jgi:hypothetical protein
MRRLRAFILRCFAALVGKRAQSDLEAELQSHLELHIEDGLRSGLSYEEARRQALVRLGGFEQTRQAVRDRHSLPWLEMLVRDLRYSLRTLLRHNVLTIIAIVSLVLLSITGLFLRSLQSAARIDIGIRTHNLLMASIDPRVHGYTSERTAQLLSALRQKVAALPGVDSAVVTDVAPLTEGNRSDAFTTTDRSAGDGQTHFADLYMVTPGYFDTLGIPRLAGRDFAGETASGPKTAVVNRAFVEGLFGGKNPIGQHVEGGGVTYRIIGVVGDGYAIDQWQTGTVNVYSETCRYVVLV